MDVNYTWQLNRGGEYRGQPINLYPPQPLPSPSPGLLGLHPGLLGGAVFGLAVMWVTSLVVAVALTVAVMQWRLQAKRLKHSGEQPAPLIIWLWGICWPFYTYLWPPSLPDPQLTGSIPGSLLHHKKHQPSELIRPLKGAPGHIAVVMDGNRRYGRAKHGEPMRGHSDGGRTLGKFVQWSRELGVKVVTVYAFSTENWGRDASEVDTLMNVLVEQCAELKLDAVKHNMRLRVLSSNPELLPADVQRAVLEAEQATAGCSGLCINICLSYGSRQEILGSCKRVAQMVEAGELAAKDVGEEVFRSHLCTRGIPDPDVLIRTSGEYRLSNFLLFQIAYSELFFLPKFWPEVTQQDLQDVCTAYARIRVRRYGR
ncbi:unnamed protein product [Chrysoparadoxa australica]